MRLASCRVTSCSLVLWLPAQYGHHSSAAINAVTTSGTNAVHGDMFEFLRGHRLNASNPFAPAGAERHE
jgi:hypothetical protein